jgi:Cation transport ATPase
VKIPQATKFKACRGEVLTAKLVEAKFTLEALTLGRAGIDVSDPKVLELMRQGKTVVFVIIDGKLAGAIALADMIRAESYEAVRELKARG